MIDPERYDVSDPDFTIWDFPEIRSDVFKRCVKIAVACVTSFQGHSGLDNTNADFRECTVSLPEKVEEGTSMSLGETMTLLAIMAGAAEKSREAENPVRSVDASFRKGALPDNPTIPRAIKFSICWYNSAAVALDGGGGFDVYATALHEGGYALGLSKFDYPLSADQPYSAAHPTVPGSTLNYDCMLNHDVDTTADPLFESELSPVARPTHTMLQRRTSSTRSFLR